MSSWRPKDWKNINPEHGKATTNDYLYAIGESFEAGADAILRALFKMATESPTGTFTVDSHAINVYLGGKNE